MVRFLLAFLLLALPAPAFATEAGWALLRNGGQVVLMRHANAPGTGEPASFDIEKCATQRNLSERGRQQARRIGALFAARAAPVEEVLTSRFCRCSETARLAFGNAEVLDALDYLPDDAEAQAARMDTLRERIRNYTGSGNLVMVTHGEVIEALTGGRTRDGEALILDRSGEALRAAARIAF